MLRNHYADRFHLKDGARDVEAVDFYAAFTASAFTFQILHIASGQPLSHPKLQPFNLALSTFVKGLSVSLKSAFVPNAFLRANGPSALVNAQFGCYKHGAESFDILPIQVTDDGVKVGQAVSWWVGGWVGLVSWLGGWMVGLVVGWSIKWLVS